MQIRNRADNVIDFMYALNISLFIFPSSGIRALRCIGGRVVCMNQHKLYTPRGAINLKNLLQLVGISNDSRVSSLFGSNVSQEYCSYHDCKNKSPVAKCDTLFCRFTDLKIKAIFFHISFTFPTSYMSRTRCISQKRVVIEIIGYTFFQRKSNNSWGEIQWQAKHKNYKGARGKKGWIMEVKHNVDNRKHSEGKKSSVWFLFNFINEKQEPHGPHRSHGQQ